MDFQVWRAQPGFPRLQLTGVTCQSQVLLDVSPIKSLFCSSAISMSVYMRPTSTLDCILNSFWHA